MVNVAILNAIKYNRKIAEVNDFDYAIDRISMGNINLLIITKELEERILLLAKRINF
jgi:ATP-dependent Zn protease